MYVSTIWLGDSAAPHAAAPQPFSQPSVLKATQPYVASHCASSHVTLQGPLGLGGCAPQDPTRTHGDVHGARSLCG